MLILFVFGLGLFICKFLFYEDLLFFGVFSKVFNYFFFYSGYEVQVYCYCQDFDFELGDLEGDLFYIWVFNFGNIGYGYICVYDDECGSEGD